jgi:hypothetical protein
VDGFVFLHVSNIQKFLLMNFMPKLRKPPFLFLNSIYKALGHHQSAMADYCFYQMLGKLSEVGVICDHILMLLS